VDIRALSSLRFPDWRAEPVDDLGRVEALLGAIREGVAAIAMILVMGFGLVASLILHDGKIEPTWTTTFWFFVVIGVAGSIGSALNRKGG
jgi:hypothetical protein